MWIKNFIYIEPAYNLSQFIKVLLNNYFTSVIYNVKVGIVIKYMRHT